MEVVFFNLGSYINLPILFAYFFGIDVPKSSSIFIENVFYYSFNKKKTSNNHR